MSTAVRCWTGTWGVFLLGAVVARAEAPPDPLRAVPVQADLVVRVDDPRKLVEAFTTLDLVRQLQKLDAIQEAMGSTNSRRFYQMVAYFEKQLDANWPEQLDRLAGGGAVFALKFGPNPAPALFVVQAKDEGLLKKFVQLGLEMVEQELARQDAKERVEKGNYRDRPTARIGKDFYLALAGPTLLLANKEEVLKRSLDLLLDGGKGSLAESASVADARKLLPANPLAWLWANLGPLHQLPQAKEVFALPRNDANLTTLAGGMLDVVGRSPFVCAALVKEGAGFTATIRMPRGREGSSPALTTHIPPPDAGSLPLLEPKGVIYSTSYYLDLAKFWDNRGQLFNDKQKKAFEDLDKTAGRFLAGNSIGPLLQQTGPHQRIVVAHQPKAGYQSQPDQRLPAFAVVLDTRDEKFGRTMETILRGTALLAGARFKLKLAEEKIGDVNLVAYRFPDDPKQPPQNNIVFNFSPCFAQVGNQFLAASTIELGREMIGLLQKEANGKAEMNPMASRSKLYASGGADLLQVIEDQLFAQAILERALPPEQAKKEVRKFIALVRGLGGIRQEVTYNPRDFRYDFRLQISHK